MQTLYSYFVNFNQSPLSPIPSIFFFSVNLIFLRLKKGKDNFLCLCVFYGLFLITRIMTTPMKATKTNRPAIAGTKYRSAVDCTGSAVGAGVGAAGSTAKLVSEYDG
jgi:hypothetical protein